MFILFGQISDKMDVFTCTFDIDIGDKRQQKTIQAPRIMIEQEFISLVQQANDSPSPIRITMSRKVPIWSQLQNKWIEREHSIIFQNLAWQNR